MVQSESEIKVVAQVFLGDYLGSSNPVLAMALAEPPKAKALLNAPPAAPSAASAKPSSTEAVRLMIAPPAAPPSLPLELTGPARDLAQRVLRARALDHQAQTLLAWTYHPTRRHQTLCAAEAFRDWLRETKSADADAKSADADAKSTARDRAQARDRARALVAQADGIYWGIVLQYLRGGRRWAASGYGKRHLLEDADLDQEILQGLRKAIMRFDPARGIAFSTYARWWVRVQVARAAQATRLIHIPVHTEYALVHAGKSAPGQGPPGQGPPGPSGPGPKAPSVSTVGAALRAIAPMEGLEALDQLVVEDNTEDSAELAIQRRRFHDALRKLAPSDRELVQQYLAGRTNRDVAKDWGVTPQRVAQVWKRVLRGLKEACGVETAGPGVRSQGPGGSAAGDLKGASKTSIQLHFMGPETPGPAGCDL